jgi:diguanylate cyclase (GGDEF)-like protein
MSRGASATATLVAALSLAAAIFGLRELVENANEGVTLLYVLPIALVAVRFGAWGGLIAAAIAMALFAIWEMASSDVSITPFGYVNRAIAFAVLGGLLGRFASERHDLIKRLHEQATTDPLTGLANHTTFYAALQDQLALAHRYEHCHAVMVADLDRFKRLNDAYGHTFGDQVLRDVAGRLRHALREVDVVARIGGDEFAALLPETSPAGARTAAHRAARAVEELRHEVAGEPVPVAISVGVTTFDGDARLTPEEVVAAADRAMYAKKPRPSGRRPQTTASEHLD